MAKNWKEEIEREKALLAASVITTAERDDIDALAERDKIRNERIANESARRDVDIENRLDAAREVLGDEVRIESVIIRGTSHTFIVKDPGPKAYGEWEKAIRRSGVKGSGIDGTQVTRTLALVAVHDWNGITGAEAWKAMHENGERTNGGELIELLKNSPGISTILCNEGTELAGLSRRDRKSED